VPRNNLTTGSGTDISSYATDSITPGANRLVLAFVMSASPANEQATAQGNGLTWVLVATVEVPQGGRLSCFHSMGAAPTSGSITFDFGGQNQDFCAWSVFEYDGVDTGGASGSGALLQSSQTSTSGLNLSIQLNPLADAAKSTIAGGLVLDQLTPVMPGTGFTLIDQQGGLQTQDRTGGGQAVDWSWQVTANAAAIALEIKAAAVVTPPALDQGPEALARRFEPILFFHPDEKFFPSDAKLYIEKCALWKAEAPFDVKDSWGGLGAPFPRNPLIDYAKIAAIQGEPGSFLGSQLVNTKTEERFLDLTGWRDATGMDEPKVTGASENRYSNRDAIAARYGPGGDLENSKFWYHAELFTNERLRRLLPTVPAPDLVKDFDGLKNAALLNYYFFFPAHEEALTASCTNIEAKEFGSFGGEWACMAVLLEQDASDKPFRPSFIGHTGRRLTASSAQASDDNDEVRRCVMKVSPFAAALDAQTGDDHPRLFVANSTHSLYVRPGTVMVDPYPAESAPHDCGRFDGPHTFGPADAGVPTWPFVTFGKAFAAAALQINVAGYLKLAAAVSAIIAEWENMTFGDPFGSTALLDQGAPDETAQPGSGKVVRPKDLNVPDGGPGQKVWLSARGSDTDVPRYDFIVDRTKQPWWPAESGESGYKGRWGPRVENDPFGRRAGMRFPAFWKMFFLAFTLGKQAGAF
jgi:hypothetical protein